MRTGLFCLALLFSVNLSAAQIFVIEFSQGESWQENLNYENQPEIEPHLQYWRQHYLNEVLLMSGPFADASGGLFVVRVKNIEAARALVAQDPGVISGKLSATVQRWRVLTSAMRSIKPQVVELESDQTFKVERLDPGSPLNLPGN